MLHDCTRAVQFNQHQSDDSWCHIAAPSETSSTLKWAKLQWSYVKVSPPLHLSIQKEFVNAVPHNDVQAILPHPSNALKMSFLFSFPILQFSRTMEDMNAKGIILRAFDQFRLKSCIDFKPRDSEEYYISATKLDGYVSYCLYFLCHSSLYYSNSFGLIRLSEVCSRPYLAFLEISVCEYCTAHDCRTGEI